MQPRLHFGPSRFMPFLRLSLVLLWVLGGQVVRAQRPPPLGDEFQVNTTTVGSQVAPSVAATGDGDFVVVWQGVISYGGNDILGQRFDAAGMAVGGEFQVNTYTTNYQGKASLAMAANGDFVVVWESQGSGETDTDQLSIQGQRFDATGMAVGGEFQVNTYTTGRQTNASVGVSAGGSSVVVWDSEGSSGTDTNIGSIQGQHYDAAGLAVGGEFQVNTYTTSYQFFPSVAVADNGAFVVVWESYGSVGDDDRGDSIQGQRYDAEGDELGGQFQVNTFTYINQGKPSVASAPDGKFVVVWEGPYYEAIDIMSRRFASNGDPLGDDFKVNTYTSSYQLRPSVAMAPGGDFIVVWNSDGSLGTDNSKGSVQGQLFRAAGSRVGGEFQVNTYTTGEQIRASVAVSDDGGFVVAWDSEGSSGSDANGQSVQGQRFGGTTIFADGFESGDTTAWSSTQ